MPVLYKPFQSNLEDKKSGKRINTYNQREMKG